MKKQRILSALLALCIVFSLVPTALAEKADDFTDVSRSDWYYQFVDYVTSKGYFNGKIDVKVDDVYKSDSTLGLLQGILNAKN